ncbi:hypothetical protein BN1048_00120 [Jeotgalicoccus saudimassiliensis]|uniref:Uncharacterized protein n=1 Tax=Jeotgalicoccus saudimassiliensis TaxID=1461582 RepID=A0A078M2C6_9STAP|nr:hypothetical protein [Jeotgalicoccus saudimassiliensis]CDZ99001.1 hypothetical protein BN1048_00120 [Jeotgalicoccus saudimassiliensis]
MIEIINVNWINLEDKKIEVKDVNIPSEDNLEIDGSGKFLMPGLVDMHTHITPTSAKHYLYSGVTSVRNTGGNFEMLNLIDDVTPNVYATYRFIDGEPGLWGPTSYGNISTNDIETALAAVDELHKQGAKFVKVYGNIQEEVLEAVGKKSGEMNLEVAADLLHTKSIDSIKAADYGVKWLEHASSIVHSLYPNYNTQISQDEFNRISQIEMDEERLTDVLAHLIEKEVKIVPTLTLYRHLAEGRIFNPQELESSKQMKLLDEDKVFKVNDQFNAIDAQLNEDFRSRQKWEYKQVKAITGKYLEIGGEVYIGTDAPAGTWVYPGLSMIEELNEFKNFNLNNFEILKKAAVESKEVIGEDNGYLLLESNPVEKLENILDINTVFVDGKRFKHNDIAQYTVDGKSLMKEFEGIERKYSL